MPKKQQREFNKGFFRGNRRTSPNRKKEVPSQASKSSKTDQRSF